MATDSWVVDGPQVIEVDDVARLRVGLVGGRADVVVHDEPVVRIEVHAVRGRPLEVTYRDGELRLGYSFTLGGWEQFLDTLTRFRGSDRADITVAVPAHVAVKLGTVTGEGLLAGVQEDSSVSTVSGSLVVDGTRGNLSARTVSGDIGVRAHSGALALNTVSGELAASGELTVVSAKTVSGRVTLDVSSETSSVTATSVSGDVTLRLPVGKGVHISGQSVSGRVVVDDQEFGGKPGRRNVDVASGDGTCHVQVSTVSGNLTVLRRAPQAA
ncbi:MAG TPA: DUF4097 family beta strand repeat-containing protein [Cellulomonas sp.]